MSMPSSVPTEQVKFHIHRMGKLSSERSNFESRWQDTAERIYPEAANFTTEITPGSSIMEKIFDPTGLHANLLLSSGLFSMLTSPSNRWFSLMPADYRLKQQQELMIYLDEVNRILFHEIHRPETGFATAMHEGYLDYGAFGNMTILLEENIRTQALLFHSLPLVECYYVQDKGGKIGTLYRKYKRSNLDLVDVFGVEALSEDIKKELNDGKLDEKRDILHVIFPRKNAQFIPGPTKTLKKSYASLYIDLKESYVLKESGFNEMPFMAARFYKSNNEVFGRGPGQTTLADVNMLQQVSKVVISAAQKATDPSLLVPHEGFLSPIKTTPGGITYYKKGKFRSAQDAIAQFPVGNPGVGIEYLEYIGKRVKEAFFVNQLQLHEGPQMTATEVIQRTEEKLRLMGPLLGRMQNELLGPMILRAYNILKRARRFPPLPDEFKRYKLRIVYTSPIARAHEQIEANGLLRALEVMRAFIEQDPQVMDKYNTDVIAEKVNDMFNLSHSFMRPQEEVDAMRADRAQAAQEAQQAEMVGKAGPGMESMVGAVKQMQEGQGEEDEENLI